MQMNEKTTNTSLLVNCPYIPPAECLKDCPKQKIIADPKMLAQAIALTAAEFEDPVWLPEARLRKLIGHYQYSHLEVITDALRRLKVLEALQKRK